MARTYRDKLRHAAAENDGYVTPRMAEDAGGPAVELRKLTARGAFEKKMRGVYRDPFHPADVLDPLRELLLSLGDGAHLAGETVLALHGLADVNPRRVYVASPRRHQRTLPDDVVVLKAVDGARVIYFDGLPCQPVSDALESVHKKLCRQRFDRAVDDAERKRLIRAVECGSLNPGTHYPNRSGAIAVEATGREFPV